MANLPAIVLDLSIGAQRQITTSDNLYVGAGIDRQTAGALSVGGTTATSLSLGSSGITTTVAGALSQTTGQVTLNGNVDATNGLDVTTAALTAAAALTVTGGAFTFSGSNINLDPTGTYDLAMDAGQTISYHLADNLANALLVQEGANTYLDITTTDAAEVITLGNATTNPDLTQAGTGQVSFAGNVDATNGLDVSVAAFTMTGTNIDLDPTGTFALDMDAAQTATITLADNLADAFLVQQAGNAYIDVTTTDASEAINLGNATTNPAITQVGTGQVTFPGNVDATNGLDVTNALLTADTGFTLSGGAFTFSGTNINLDPTGTYDLAMDAAQTISIHTADNLASAYLLEDSNGDDYIKLDTTTSAEKLTFGNAATNPAYEMLGTGQFDIGGDVVVAGNFTVEGASFISEAETVLYNDNHLYLNNGYETVSAETGGLVVNYLPTATNDTVAATGFVAGVPATSNPTVNTTAAATFSVGDLIQITGANSAENNGLFEVLSHAANLLTIRGIGTSATTQDWVQNQFATDTTVAGTIRKVTCSVIRAGTDGVWEVGSGSTTTGFTFSDLATSAGSTLGQAYTAGRAITGNLGPITYAFSTVAGGVWDINVGAGAAVLADSAAIFDVSYGANAYTGGASVLNGDWSGMASLTLAGDAAMINLAGISNSGAGDTIGIVIDANFDQGIENASSYIQTGSAFTFSGSNLDLDPTGTFALDMDAAQTATITLADNLADAFLIQEGANAYIDVTTTNAAEAINLGNAVTNPTLSQLGTGQVTFAGNVDATNGLDVSVAALTMTGTNIDLDPTGTFALDMDAAQTVTITLSDNLGSALLIQEGANAYIDVDTTNAAEVITLGNGVTNPAITQVGTGQVTFTGNVDATNGLDVSVADFTFTGPNFNLDPTGDFTCDMDAGGTVDFTMNDSGFTVSVADNTANAFLVQQGADVYLDVDTTDAAEAITIGNATTDPEINFPGDGEWNMQGSPGTAGYALVSNGAGSAPTWQAVGEAGQVVTGDWDTNTNGVAANEVAAYTTTADRADQADATAASGAQTCIGICQLQHATLGEIVRAGRYTTAKFIAALTLNNGDRCFVSKTAGSLTNDVSGYTTGDKVIPVGWVRDNGAYAGSSVADIELDFGEITTIA